MILQKKSLKEKASDGFIFITFPFSAIHLRLASLDIICELIATHEHPGKTHFLFVLFHFFNALLLRSIVLFCISIFDISFKFIVTSLFFYNVLLPSYIPTKVSFSPIALYLFITPKSIKTYKTSLNKPLSSKCKKMVDTTIHHPFIFHILNRLFTIDAFCLQLIRLITTC